jgi:phosphoribosylcarboxyaminoimidazole (NCAIR) mutase
LARTLSHPGKPDRYGNTWQYHSRSDRHSKIACWSILFEALQHSSLLRRHVETGKVVFGVNQEMRDFQTNRTKDLDLVIATPGGRGSTGRSVTLADLAVRWSVRLSEEQQRTLAALPAIVEGPTGMVLAALEAKACMTAHIKALPRLFDELNSSHATVHANTNRALAVGFAMVNASPTFISPDLNKFDLRELPAVVSQHRQPHWTQRTVDKLRDIPRRTANEGHGFDAFGIGIVDMANDGTPVEVVSAPPAPRPADVDHYDQMIYRLVHGYDTAFGTI